MIIINNCEGQNHRQRDEINYPQKEKGKRSAVVEMLCI